MEEVKKEKVIIEDEMSKQHKTPATLASEDLFCQKSNNDKKLKKDKAEAFHTAKAQGFFLSKRARTDIHT